MRVNILRESATRHPPAREGETAVTGDDVKQSTARWNRTRELLTHDKKLQLYHCTTMTERSGKVVICE